MYRGAADPLSGPDHFYKLVYSTLLANAAWDHSGHVVYMDAAFTSCRLFRDLWQHRGIGAVGPVNAQKPKEGGGKNSWSHQKYEDKHCKYLPRGWDRCAFSPIDGGGWLQAIVWRDNKFVKLLSTVFLTRGVKTVKRWSKPAKNHAQITVREVVTKYHKHFAYVDRADKNAALAALLLGRCKQRFHRLIFLWYLAMIGFNNLIALFMMLFNGAAKFTQKKEDSGFG